MPNITQTCASCNRAFYIIEQEQYFLQERKLPFPTNCPTCRQARRLKLRGGERALYKTTCHTCKKEIIVSYDPTKVTNPILCKTDFDKFLSENDLIIKDPLPEA